MTEQDQKVIYQSKAWKPVGKSLKSLLTTKEGTLTLYLDKLTFRPNDSSLPKADFHLNKIRKVTLSLGEGFGGWMYIRFNDKSAEEKIRLYPIRGKIYFISGIGAAFSERKNWIKALGTQGVKIEKYGIVWFITLISIIILLILLALLWLFSR